MSGLDPRNRIPVEEGLGRSIDGPIQRLSMWLESEGEQPQQIVSGINRFRAQSAEIFPELSEIGLSVAKGENGGLHMWLTFPIKGVGIFENPTEDQAAANKRTLEIARDISRNNPDIHAVKRLTPHSQFIDIADSQSPTEALTQYLDSAARELDAEELEFHNEIEFVFLTRIPKINIGIIKLSQDA